jgi:hypothetical protein
MSDADKNLVRTLYPNGGPQYEEMMTNLQSSRNSMTASGFKKEDLTMGPSGLGAYGEMRGGKAYLRVIVEARDKLPPIDTPRETTPEGGPSGYFRDYIPDDNIEP